MDSGSISDFVKQVPIWLILAPVVLAVLYGVMMLVIFQRARERRRKRTPSSKQNTSTNNFSPDGTLLAQGYPQPAFAGGISAAPQPHAVPARMSQISSSASTPEPDFDALVQSMSSPMPTVPPPTPTVSPIPLPQFESPLVPESDDASSANGGDAVEVMRILRDLSTGKLIVEIAGRQYHSPADIPNIEQARRFQSVVRELNALITPASASGNPIPIRRPLVESGAALPDIKASSTPPAPIESPLALRRGAPASPEAQNRGIADQIENYLQYKLANTPQFQHRSIHIRPTDEGGVLIEVEGQVFHGMDTVSDPEVRAFLNSTLREWEARQ